MQSITVVDSDQRKTDRPAASVYEIAIQSISQQIRPTQGYEAHFARPTTVLIDLQKTAYVAGIGQVTRK
jgi:hypothetical protein